MKYISILFFLILLTACSPATPSPDDLMHTATWQVYNNDVATIVAGTQTARAPTETPIPPPKLLSLSELILTQEELADIQVWNEFGIMDNDSYSNFFEWLNWESGAFCLKTCIGRLWLYDEQYVGVFVVISSFYTDESALTAFQTISESQNVTVQKVSEYPDLVGFPLPENSLLIKHEHTWVSIISHQRSFIVFTDVLLSEKSQLENIYSAAVIMDRQLNKLAHIIQ